jgi:hypothetical protein
MCVYCKAASAVLDTLWESEDFRDYFYELGYDLAELGPLTHDVFVPAYLAVKVTEDILGPLYDRPSFRDIWEAWDQEMREAFVREQSEMELARLLLMVYDVQLSDSFQRAFAAYHNSQ